MWEPWYYYLRSFWNNSYISNTDNDNNIPKLLIVFAGGVFAQYNKVSSTSGSQPTTNSSHSISSMNLNNLRYRRPLISPARFEPKSQSKSQPFPLTSNSQSTRFASLSSAKNLFSSGNSQGLKNVNIFISDVQLVIFPHCGHGLDPFYLP